MLPPPLSLERSRLSLTITQHTRAPSLGRKQNPRPRGVEASPYLGVSVDSSFPAAGAERVVTRLFSERRKQSDVAREAKQESPELEGGAPLHRSWGEGRSPGADPQLQHSETVWPWASRLPSLCTPIVMITAGLWLPHARLCFGLHIAFSSACPVSSLVSPKDTCHWCQVPPG